MSNETPALNETEQEQAMPASPVQSPIDRANEGVVVSSPTPVSRPPSISSAGTPESANIDMLMDVTMQVAVELGRTRVTVKQVLDLQSGSVIELDRLAGDVVDIFVNDHLLARGEVVVVDDKFGVRITELVSPKSESSGS
jgi:flagellar motor switch protein FliN/FliY